MGGRTKKAWPGCNPRGFSTPVAPGNEKAVALGSALDLIKQLAEEVQHPASAQAVLLIQSCGVGGRPVLHPLTWSHQLGSLMLVHDYFWVLLRCSSRGKGTSTRRGNLFHSRTRDILAPLPDLRFP